MQSMAAMKPINETPILPRILLQVEEVSASLLELQQKHAALKACSDLMTVPPQRLTRHMVWTQPFDSYGWHVGQIPRFPL